MLGVSEGGREGGGEGGAVTCVTKGLSQKGWENRSAKLSCRCLGVSQGVLLVLSASHAASLLPTLMLGTLDCYPKCSADVPVTTIP